MCGIAGIIRFQTGAVSLTRIEQMTNSIRHRGPDDEGLVFFDTRKKINWQYGGKDTPEGIYTANFSYMPKQVYSGQNHNEASMAFGHRRLAVIDLSAKGHQPMCTPDKRYWIVYNGEIYNYLELREELVRHGYSFHSNSDTEVLLNGYARWGLHILNRLIGMFAFVIYDQEERRLFFARDFFGIKPLYYTMWAGGIAFASEIKALLTLPQVSRKVNPQKVYDYLRFGITDHGEKTMFDAILQLPAAHFIECSLEFQESLKPVRYWDVDLNKKSDISFPDAAEKVKDIFWKNIELHMRSDVPIGVALSGGIDSSAIVMTMHRLAGKSLNLNSFSYIADDHQICEEKWIDLVGKATCISVHKVCPSHEDLMSDLEDLISVQDEPFASTSIYAQYRVMRLARENGIKVILDGQGADELLGGYPGLWGARLASLIRKMQCFKAIRFFYKIVQNEDAHWLIPLLRAGNYYLPSFFRPLAFKIIGRSLTPDWLSEQWFKNNGVVFNTKRVSFSKDILREELYRSLMNEGLISILRHEDRNAMAFSIESRVPFLTPELVSFVLSLPENYIVNSNGTSKLLFREAMRGNVPDVILNRKDKIGFTTPEQIWLKASYYYVESVVNSNTAKTIPVLNSLACSKVCRKLINDQVGSDYTPWRLINFISWVKQFSAEF
jgi:asparagine synthase (glutamine-hydrolysing)